MHYYCYYYIRYSISALRSLYFSDGFLHVTYTAHFPLCGSDYRGLLYVYVHICTIHLCGYMYLCTYISRTLLGFSIGSSHYPALWNGGGGGLKLIHSTGTANPVAELTSSIRVWIEPSPVVDSITTLGRLQLKV